jgi:predicted DNA-binding transcriptional regulator AlpA
MHNEALTRATLEAKLLPAIKRIEAHGATPSSPTRLRSNAQTARGVARDFTPFQSMQLLRIDDVCRLLRISKPTFWRLRRRTDFPEPTAVTERVMAWSGRDIQAWIERRRLPLRR